MCRLSRNSAASTSWKPKGFSRHVAGELNVFNITKQSRYLLYTDDIKIFRAVNSADDCTLLQADIKHIRAWCATNCLKFNVSMTRVITFSRKTNGLYYVSNIQDSSIICTVTSKDLGVKLHSKLHFHAYVDYILPNPSGLQD
jgi:hypothetical protein